MYNVLLPYIVMNVMLRCDLLGNEAYQRLSMDCRQAGWYDRRRRRHPVVT